MEILIIILAKYYLESHQKRLLCEKLKYLFLNYIIFRINLLNN